VTDPLAFVQRRRSIRQFKPEPVSDEQVETLLRAAMAAPSAGNQQPWAFVVIRDRERLERVHDFHPYAGPLRTAALAILVCGDLERQKHQGYWVQDCSAAVENLLLAAANMGLGTCWLGVHPRPEREAGCRALCAVPDSLVPFALIAVGVPDEAKGPADYYHPGRVHQETW